MPLLALALVVTQLAQFRYPSGHHSFDLAWEGLCLAIGLAGLLVRVFTAGHVPARTSGRNTRSQVAGRLNTTGTYSVVRHPLYLGNYLMWLSVALFPRVWWLPLVLSLAFCVYYERIVLVEEEFLHARHGMEFERWARQTPAFLPRVRKWRAPDLKFSLRAALRREYPTTFALIVAFTALEIGGDVSVYGRLHFDPAWSIIFGVGLIAFVLIRILDRRTRLLVVQGR